MSNSALLISDDLARSEPVAARLAQWLPVSSVALSEFDENSDQDALFLLIDIDLSDRKNIEQFKNKFRSVPSKKEKVFLTRQKFEAEVVRANALGATATLPSFFSKTDLNRILGRYAVTPERKKRPDPDIPEETAKAVEGILLKSGNAGNCAPSNGPRPTVQAATTPERKKRPDAKIPQETVKTVEGIRLKSGNAGNGAPSNGPRSTVQAAATPDNKKQPDAKIPEETAKAVESIRLLNDSFYDAVSSNGPLPKDQVIVSCDEIIESLADSSIGSWLHAVRQHDSYTYRHCMTVSGLAVSFATHLGMCKTDVQRIGVGALMHDIGKVRIALSILDKPGKLSPEERTEINKHPGYGAEMLRNDGQFEDEVIEIALRHHELLDGTGYPDGLTADQISDPIRIMTIVDIYSALIDKRAYKDAMPADKAYQIQLDMGGKLDRDILREFEPIAYAAGNPSLDASSHQGATA